MLNAKSFGVPIFAPYAPLTRGVFIDELTKSPIWKQQYRPDSVNAQAEKKQPEISRGWTKNTKEDDNGGK